jgi:hypothetical protein
MRKLTTENGRRDGLEFDPRKVAVETSSKS